MTVSANYTKLEPHQIDVMTEVFANAWQNPEIPARQYESIVKQELEDYRRGGSSAPFDSLIGLLSRADRDLKTILDVGASSGYYSEVLKIRGFTLDYTALDYSTYYRDLAIKLFPEIEFKIGSATELPFEDASFDIVLHGACIMHIRNYELAIQEAARVASRVLIFHRTPIYTDDTPTEAFVKTAYGVPCVEFHFNEKEILGLFEKHGLRVTAAADVFTDGHFGHRSYLLSK